MRDFDSAMAAGGVAAGVAGVGGLVVWAAGGIQAARLYHDVFAAGVM